jgi:hypothetical protein
VNTLCNGVDMSLEEKYLNCNGVVFMLVECALEGGGLRGGRCCCVFHSSTCY